MRLIPVKYLKEKSCIAIDIIDDQGRTMLKKGQKITAQGIQILKNLGVAAVYIEDEYCLNQNTYQYTMELGNIFKHIEGLREIGSRINEGTSGGEDIVQATMIANEIVDEMLMLPPESKIVYEPCKLRVNSVVEQNIYIAMMATALGVKMGLQKKDLVKLCIATLLKDVALLSPKILAEHATSYKTHPLVAYKYLKEKYQVDEEILKGVLQHHEYNDGTGFPNKLKGKEICTFARIISLVDCFYEVKATHEHLDSTEMLFEVKLKHILRKFDPEMITYFIRNAEVFSKDTLIRLSNDDLAVIYENNPANPFRPTIKMIQSYTYDEGEIIHLQDSSLIIKNIEYYVEN